MDENNQGIVEDERNGGSRTPIRVLLLDDREDNLIVRSAILRQKGYDVLTSKSVEEAEAQLEDIDIAVLDYNLGQGKFGTEVAESLRRKRPQVPIIILSATLERKFGGIADMHLLKGYSSVDDLVSALRSFEAKQRGRPVVVDARDFFYSRISMAMGDDVALEVLDREGEWQYVNDYFASLSGRKRVGSVGKTSSSSIPSWATSSGKSSAPWPIPAKPILTAVDNAASHTCRPRARDGIGTSSSSRSNCTTVATASCLARGCWNVSSASRTNKRRDFRAAAASLA